MSKYASINMPAWMKRQNNLGPNSQEYRKDNLSRLVCSASWPARGEKEVFVAVRLQFSNTLAPVTTLTWIPVGLFFYSNIRFYSSTLKTRTCPTAFQWESCLRVGHMIWLFCIFFLQVMEPCSGLHWSHSKVPIDFFFSPNSRADVLFSYQRELSKPTIYCQN